MLAIINSFILLATSFFLLVLGVSCIREKENRAAVIVFISFFLNSFVWMGWLYFSESFHYINFLLVIMIVLFSIISMIRFFPDPPVDRDLTDAEQYDERDNMFARNNLQHSPELMDVYYTLHPENKSIDMQIHQKPEFGETAQRYHDAYTAPCYAAAFEYLERSIPLSTGNAAEKKIIVNPEKFSKTITEFARFYGACDVSFCRLCFHHFYSKKGRHASHWGEKTDQTHTTAIVIVVPMRVEMIKQGPTSSVLQESAQKYVEAAKISNIVAGYIRNFGYQARAHNDANYDTLCVPIAVESGIGELGRMGIFMHRVYGPCVRLAIVTTDLELPASFAQKSLHMEKFCKICKKCADNCPSGSISHADEPVTRNFRHWSILQEKCFSYWKTIGSDCGVCISVCPYTKPDTLIHQFVRWYISRSPLNQKIALFMDDLLYGRHKKIPKNNPEHIFNPLSPE